MTEVVSLYQPGTELWLDETSNIYGGGAADLSDSYAAGFMQVTLQRPTHGYSSGCAIMLLGAVLQCIL